MFSILTSFSLVATALIPSVYAVASPVQSPVGDLEPRPDANATSACKAYGIDYQSGGSYFIDQNSRLPFTAVTKFEG